MVVYTCACCNNEFQIRRNTLMAKQKRGILLCKGCALKNRKDHKRNIEGIEKNKTRRNFITLIRNLTEYDQWRKQVYFKDKWTCFNCGYKGSKINAHHIEGINYIVMKYNIKTIDDALNCPYLWDVSNGITVCSDCHHELHRNGG